MGGVSEGRQGGRTGAEYLNRPVVRCSEKGAGPTTIKNGSSERSCPMEMCQEGSSINILIKASVALEGPREQTAFHQPRGLPKPFSRHVNWRTFRFCQCCIVRVLAFPKELGLNARPQTCSTKFLYSPFPSYFHLLSISPSVGFSGLTKRLCFRKLASLWDGRVHAGVRR